MGGSMRPSDSWSPQERQLHINCLELLAAQLALKTFVKSQQDISVLLQLDNSTAVAYINNLGGTVSPTLTALAKSMWLWALERDIMIMAQHIPGVSNMITDDEFRLEGYRSDWMLACSVFLKINQVLGPLDVDLFASRLTHQLPQFFSWRPDPLAEAVDAFQQDGSKVRGYANHPWCLIGHVLNKIKTQQAQVILIAPVWKSQIWYPVILEMLMDYPRLIPPQENLLQKAQSHRVMDIMPQLAIWPVSRRNTELLAFQQQLQTSCWSPGGRSPHILMTPYSEDGLAGVLRGIMIPFQVDVANFLTDLHMEGYQSR